MVSISICREEVLKDTRLLHCSDRGCKPIEYLAGCWVDDEVVWDRCTAAKVLGVQHVLLASFVVVEV